LELQTSLIEYIKGDPGSKIILTAPHGGLNDPGNVTRRIAGCSPTKIKGECIYTKNSTCADDKNCRVVSVTDAFTIQILKSAAQVVKNQTGMQPHIIISHLKRTFLDPNRNITEAAQGDAFATKVYNNFHGAVEEAKASVERGILFDFHGQGHSHQLVELGYLLSPSQLDSGEYDPLKTSVKSLVQRCRWNFTNDNDANANANLLLHPQKSLGALFQAEGFGAIPSPAYPSPNGRKYYRGGYITRYHGSRYEGNVDAIQLEMPKNLRLQRNLRKPFAKAVGRVISTFYSLNYNC